MSDQTVDPGSDCQLLFDDAVIESQQGLRRCWHQAVKHPGGSVLPIVQKGESGWQAGMPMCFGSVLFDEDEGLFKMWYGLHEGGELDDAASVLAYATSVDGIEWNRPALRLLEYRGTINNNVVKLRDGLACSVIKDEPESDPAKRYKMLFCNERMQIDAAYSPDGLRWTEHAENPVIFNPPGHDSQNVLYRDDRLGKYVAIVRERTGMIRDVRPQLIHDDEARQSYRRLLQRWPDEKSLRRVGQSESDDLIDWSPVRVVVAADEQDPVMRGEFYNMQVLQYDGVRIGFVTVFTYDDRYCRGAVQLTFSRDGMNWERSIGRHAFLYMSEQPGDFDWGAIYAFQSPLVVGDEIWIYYNGVGLDHNHEPLPGVAGFPNGVGLARLRLDGFVSVGTHARGSLTTKPLVLGGTTLAVNADAAGGSLRVEILDEQSRPIAPCESENCDLLRSDEIRHTVSWGGASGLEDIAGRTVRLRFHLENAQLYSFRFA